MSNESGQQEVYVRTYAASGASAPQKLFEGSFIWQRAGNHDVSHDGERFVMIRGEGGMVDTELRVVLNWLQELHRLAPL